MERDFEKDMMELDAAIKSNAERDNTFTLSVLQRAKTIMLHQEEKLKAYEDTGLTPEEIMDGKTLTGWIPVEKRVPEENGLYVVAIMAMGIAGPIYMHDLTDYEKESGWYARNVVAWLPCKLPKPYRPETLREAGTEAAQNAAEQVLQSAT